MCCRDATAPKLRAIGLPLQQPAGLLEGGGSACHKAAVKAVKRAAQVCEKGRVRVSRAPPPRGETAEALAQVREAQVPQQCDGLTGTSDGEPCVLREVVEGQLELGARRRGKRAPKRRGLLLTRVCVP